jgi:hypothetical protein
VAVSLPHSRVCRNFDARVLNSFHSSRYPTKPADTARKFDPTQSNHIILVRKNKFFEVPLEYNGVELSEAELQVCVFAHLLRVVHLFTLHPPVKSKRSSSLLELSLVSQLALLPVKIATFGLRQVREDDTHGIYSDHLFDRPVKI